MSPVYKDLTDSDLSVNRFEQKEKGSVGLKVTVALAFILALGACGIAYYAYSNLGSALKNNAALEAENENLSAEAEQLRLKSGSLEEKEADYIKQISSLTAFVDKSNQKIADLNQALADKDGQIQVLEKQVTDLKDSAAPAQLLTEAKTVISPGAAALFQGEEAADGTAGGEAQNVIPQVMTVNREFGFVVINLGATNGIQVGNEFSVLRNGQSIASLSVERIYEGFAAATIVKESNDNPIQEGDLIESVKGNA